MLRACCCQTKPCQCILHCSVCVIIVKLLFSVCVWQSPVLEAPGTDQKVQEPRTTDRETELGEAGRYENFATVKGCKFFLVVRLCCYQNKYDTCCTDVSALVRLAFVLSLFGRRQGWRQQGQFKKFKSRPRTRKPNMARQVCMEMIPPSTTVSLFGGFAAVRRTM